MANRLLPVATFLFAGIYFYLTAYHVRMRDFGDPVGPRMFPYLLCAGLVLAAIMLAYENYMAVRNETAFEEEPRRPTTMPIAIVGVLALSVIYFLAFERVGYAVSTTIYLLILTFYFHKGRPVVNVGTSVLVPLVTYVLFTRVLDVSLPAGILPF